MNPVPKLLALIFCLFPLALLADEDPFPEFWYLMGKDSTLAVTSSGEVAEMASSEALEHSRHLDSLCNLREDKDFKCVLGYHIGACDSKRIRTLEDYFRKHTMTVAAVGCRSGDGKLKVIRIKNTLPFRFSDEALEREFKEANDDPEFYRNRKSEMEKSQKRYEAWEKSPEGKAYSDSLEKKYGTGSSMIFDTTLFDGVPKP